MRGGGGGGGGGGGEGWPFYRAFGHLKGPQASEEQQGRRFHYYSKIYPAPAFILQK